MKKIKKRIQKKQPVVTNDNYQLKNFIIMIIVIAVIVGILYFITNLVIKNTDDEEQVDTTTVTTEIQNEKILVGQMFNRSESEYYVLAYKNDDQFMNIYESYINEYTSNEYSVPVYKIDLNEGLNKNYLSDDLNISDDLKNLKINDTVLFKINDSKIDNYYVGNSQIIEFLKEINE